MIGYVVKLIKKIPFYRRYTTKQFTNWWANRKIDWKQEYLDSWQHPHRYLITEVLSKFKWTSLFEIGCGSGANGRNILSKLSNRQIGGIDVNPEAIAVAQKEFKGGLFKVGSGEDIMLSDSTVDVVLSDMFLLYIGPFKIRKYIREMARIARNHVILCELHSDSWWKRMKLRIFSGNNAYNYVKLLEKEGFYDIIRYKIPVKYWADDDNQEFRNIIIARAPIKL